MSQWAVAAVGAVGVLGLLLLMVLAWRARGRRQADVPAPPAVPAVTSPATHEADVAYVATTRAGDPLDRVVVHGLGFRGPARVAVHAEGVRVDVAGRDPFFVATDQVDDVRRATWTIDRVVERDGLVLLAWRLGTVPVETYLRPGDDPRPLVAAVRSVLDGRRRPGSDDETVRPAPTAGSPRPADPSDASAADAPHPHAPQENP